MRLSTATMPRLPALVLLAAGLSGLGLAVAACGSADKAAAGEPGIYVFNFHHAEQGRADQRPRDLVLSEFSTMSRVTWSVWGPSRASGTGKLSGMWCLPRCADTPYDATVTLSSVIPVRGKGYFTRYRVSVNLPEAERDGADLAGILRTP
jgi:hypothetical protein